MTDLIRELGALSLASRLKRLSDLLMQDGIRIYRSTGSEFQPKWFPVYYHLAEKGPSSVMTLTTSLGISHPSINSIVNEMINAGYVAAYKDTKDKRKRVLALTQQAKQARESLENIWRPMKGALDEVIESTGVDLLGYLDLVETVLKRKSLVDRFEQRYQIRLAGISVSTYQEKYAAAFKSINEAWIVEHFELEASDLLALDNPEGYIVRRGGEILFAVDDTTSEVLGTCALIKTDEGRIELAKMGVVKPARGSGIGKLLALSALEKAREMGAQTLHLESNSRLAPAIGLYKSIGFVRQPFPTPSDYNRADVYMELSL
jgi:DNA-binding MarR family transcriptional regulator/predicted GNAT family acetyltransferase